MLRLVQECRPALVFIEHVDGGALRHWYGNIRSDLKRAGYHSRALRSRAREVGAPFLGSRIFIAATNRDSESVGPLYAEASLLSKSPDVGRINWGNAPAEALGVADGVPFGMDRLRCCGNAVVPLQAQAAFKRLMGV